MANEYDKILKENFREPKATLLRRLVGEDITGIKSLVPKLQRTLEREPDTVAEVVTAAGKRFIVHIEWQSNNDATMAERMALYDLLLAQHYRQEVLGVVLYLGNKPMRMEDTYAFFKFHYQCEMIDARQFDPEVFLQSEDAGEVIFAVLAGNDEQQQKTAIIRRILAKLQLLLINDAAALQVKIRQLETLSLLRGKDIQQIILQEENKMPVTIDITQDLRYQQGVQQELERNRKEKLEMAESMFKDGLSLPVIQKYTGLSIDELNSIIEKAANK